MTDNSDMGLARQKPWILAGLFIFSTLFHAPPGLASESQLPIRNFSKKQAEYYHKLKKIPFAQHRSSTAENLKNKLRSESNTLKKSFLNSPLKKKATSPQKRPNRPQPQSTPSPPPSSPAPFKEELTLEPGLIPAEIHFSGKKPRTKKSPRSKPQFIRSRNRRSTEGPRLPPGSLPSPPQATQPRPKEIEFK